jgi:geranylgeranyl pyrophosphate synthase
VSTLAGHPDAIRAVLGLVQPGLARVEASLAELANSDDPILAPMLSAILPGGGKRLRPALALLIGRMAAAARNDAAAADAALKDLAADAARNDLATTAAALNDPAAAAARKDLANDGDAQDPSAVGADALIHMAVGVELLHTASLVHDDIVDESDTRHGGATLYARVGNALAVLVGDYLFSQAAQACVATGNLDVVRLFAQTLGAMAQGQIDDANGQLSGRHLWESLTRDRYYRTIGGKTASLFVLACQGTGLLVGLEPAQVDGLRVYGENLGLAFQVFDDILDFTATEAELGKPVGSDLRQGTVTLPVILMRDQQLADGRFRAAFEAEDVDLQVRLVQESGAIAAANAEAEILVERARAALAVLPEGIERDALDALARYVTRRGH